MLRALPSLLAKRMQMATLDQLEDATRLEAVQVHL